MKNGCWFVLCGSLAVALASHGDPNMASNAPIRRVVVYKDGHCFTQREATVLLSGETAYLSELPHALLGTVWAYTRDREVKVVQLRAEWLEEKREIAPQNVAELLALNEGAQVEMELLFPPPDADSTKPVSTETYQGVLRVFKPELRYADAYPTHDPPPPFSPQAIVEPRPRRREYDPYWYGGYWASSTPPDYVQDEWSRTVNQSSFALETARGLVMFKASQVKRVQFLSSPKRHREITLRRPRLAFLLSGAKAGQRVPLVLAAIERGIRWIPEYHLVLPTEASDATLLLHATLINELSDLQDAEVSVAVGAPQFIMQDQVSPLAMRETFKRLSRWFGEPEDIYQRAIAGQLGGFGGFGGSGGFGGAPAAPSTGAGFGGGGMGFHSSTSSMAPTDMPLSGDTQVEVLSQLTLIKLPRVTLPKDATAHYTILQQSVPYKRICYWSVDLTQQESGRWYWYRPEPRRFSTFEDISYQLARQRNLWGEVQDALLLENKGDVPWTTAPITIMQGNAIIAQDMLLFTPPGGEAVLILGPAPQVNLSHTILHESRWDEKRNRPIEVKRGVIRVTNSRQTPVPLMVRVRFVGHYTGATLEPTRVSYKTGETEDFWSWYHQQRLQANPYTELVWEMLVPPGTRDWEYHYEMRQSP